MTVSVRKYDVLEKMVNQTNAYTSIKQLLRSLLTPKLHDCHVSSKHHFLDVVQVQDGFVKAYALEN